MRPRHTTGWDTTAPLKWSVSTQPPYGTLMSQSWRRPQHCLRGRVPMVAPPNHGNAAALSLDSRLRILIVSPVRLLRDGLATMVKQRANVQSVAVAESTEAAIMVLEPFRPTFILLDVATEDGLSAARRLVA